MPGDSFKKEIETGLGGVVIMAGSDSDKPHIDKITKNLEEYKIPFEIRIASAHKQPETVLRIMKEYDSIKGPLVYVAVAGGTDALSGMLSFQTYRPVISCPPDAPNETCLTNPPGSSNAYIANPKNLVRFIAQVLSSGNKNYKELILSENAKKIEKLEKSDSEFQGDYSNLALSETDNFNIRHQGNVHSGKVRSVYWLTNEDSERLIKERNYPVAPGTQLGVMIISDRISAFDCNWQAEHGLKGVPGKGAALNAISKYWFDKFKESGLAENHILEVPHPLVWIVQKAEPVMVEAIARQYITGSMWRAYEKGERVFCGISIPDNLKKNQKLDRLLITPSTKGIMRGIPGVPEEDDVNITKNQIESNYQAFGFKTLSDINKYEEFLKQGFDIISKELERAGQIFVDTKFEFGYIKDSNGNYKIIYIDEIGTPDSSRMWDSSEYLKGNVVENSKEAFREFLLNTLDKDILLDKTRMAERKELAKNNKVPISAIMKVSKTYLEMAEKITGKNIPKISSPKQEIINTLTNYNLIG